MKLAMTHEPLNLLALNVRSKVTCVQQAGSSMSLVHWLQEGDSSMPRKTDGATASANKEVQKAQEQAQRQKRQSNDKTCAKITKYLCDNGNKGAASKFSAELGHVVTESTVHNMKKAYLSLLKKEKDPDKIKSLPHATRGRPLLLRGYDKDITIVHSRSVNPWKLCVGVKYYIVHNVQYAILHLW